jgi:predicted house-cleaning NTP pyrophosphatase (Maf/HAM1 superfamily)
VVLEVELVVVVLVLVADAVVVEDDELLEKPNHFISCVPWMGTV